MRIDEITIDEYITDKEKVIKDFTHEIEYEDHSDGMVECYMRCIQTETQVVEWLKELKHLRNVYEYSKDFNCSVIQAEKELIVKTCVNCRFSGHELDEKVGTDVCFGCRDHNCFRLKNKTAQELFENKCPYTGKECENGWNCQSCKVEKAEREFVRDLKWELEKRK